MTSTLAYHLALQTIGGQTHLQLSNINLHLPEQITSSEPGLTPLQVGICSTCLTILKRHADKSLVWPSLTDPTGPDQPPSLFPLCAPELVEPLTATGHLATKSPSSDLSVN